MDGGAERQYELKRLNVRIAGEADAVRAAEAAPDGIEILELFCTCGDRGCDELISLPRADYEPVRRYPHRFLVLPGHQTPLDDVVEKRDGYYVVEVRRPHRLASAPERR